MSIFNQSVELIVAVEHKLLDKKKRSISPIVFIDKIMSYFKREFLFPFKLIGKGIEIVFMDIIKFVVISSFGFILVWILFGNDLFMPSNSINEQIVKAFIFLFSIFIALFSIPSVMPKHGVNNKHIVDVVQEINKLEILKEHIKYIEKNIEIFQLKFKSRVIFFRSLLALAWAYNTYWFLKVIDKLIETNEMKLIASDYMSVYLILLVMFLIVEFYSKGSLFIFKSIEFGLNELNASYEIVEDERKNIKES